MGWHIPDIDVTCLIYAYQEVLRWLQQNGPIVLLISNVIVGIKAWAYASAKSPDNKIRTLAKAILRIDKLIKWMKPRKEITISNINETIPEGKLLGIAIYQMMCSGESKYKAPDDILEHLKTELHEAEEYWRKIHGKD